MPGTVKGLSCNEVLKKELAGGLPTARIRPNDCTIWSADQQAVNLNIYFVGISR